MAVKKTDFSKFNPALAILSRPVEEPAEQPAEQPAEKPASKPELSSKLEPSSKLEAAAKAEEQSAPIAVEKAKPTAVPETEAVDAAAKAESAVRAESAADLTPFDANYDENEAFVGDAENDAKFDDVHSGKGKRKAEPLRSFSFKLNREDYTLMRFICGLNGVSMNEYIVRLIRADMKNYEKYIGAVKEINPELFE